MSSDGGASSETTSGDPRDAEIAGLRERVAALERMLAAPVSEPGAGLLRAIVDNSPAVIFVRDREGRYVLINRRYEALFHVTDAQIRGMTDFDLFPPELARGFAAHDAAVIASGVAGEREEVVPSEDGPHTYITLKFPILNPDGTVFGVGGIATDITDRKRGEQERAALQQQMLAAQEALVRELSTPLIPLAKGVLALPMIGTIDARRAEQLMHALLDGVSRLRARVAILDITGVTAIDATSADALVRAAAAARMLGGEVVLTGIGAEAAATMVESGASFAGIVTLGDLEAGIAYGLARPRR
jgi:rsbT co-antagonist protein RsbR